MKGCLSGLVVPVLFVVLLAGAVYLVGTVYANDECGRYGWPAGRFSLAGIDCVAGPDSVPLGWLAEGRPASSYRPGQ